jgi:energy-coupling factor transporter ATP-binding protein EcfA2
VQGLTKRLGDVLAVDRLSFQVDEGTVAGFLGPNGAGKTTTLRMLLGLAAALLGDPEVLAIAVPWLPAKGVDVVVADPGLAARVAGLLLWQGGLEDLVVGVLGRPGLGRWLPHGAAAALTAPGDATLAMWAGALVLAAYGLVLAWAGGRLVVARDLT